jgi:hypothetical protein
VRPRLLEHYGLKELQRKPCIIFLTASRSSFVTIVPKNVAEQENVNVTSSGHHGISPGLIRFPFESVRTGMDPGSSRTPAGAVDHNILCPP